MGSLFRDAGLLIPLSDLALVDDVGNIRHMPSLPRDEERVPGNTVNSKGGPKRHSKKQPGSLLGTCPGAGGTSASACEE